MARRFTYGDKFKPGEWVIDTLNSREVVVLGRFPADDPNIARTYEVMRPFTADGDIHMPYGLSVHHMRKKSEFQVGDKVRPIAGEVIDIESHDNHVRVKWSDDTGYGWFKAESLELVERPKKEPKLGSVWRCTAANSKGHKYIYVGDGTYYRVNDGWLTRYDYANAPDWTSVNDNA